MKPEEIKGAIVCEESQAITIAFRELDFKFDSCDLQDCRIRMVLIFMRGI